MKAQSNSKHRALEFAIGDWVWLRLHHRTAAGITPIKSSKLSPHFYGMYKVVEHIGNVAYHLQLPSKAKIHNVLHVALLKKIEGTPPEAVVPLLVIQHKLRVHHLRLWFLCWPFSMGECFQHLTK
jgi:hypothetical protein